MVLHRVAGATAPNQEESLRNAAHTLIFIRSIVATSKTS